nr:stage 0 sporulation family protein [uncultured Cellulosilyticum sp.]
MITVIGIRFRRAGKIYYFEPENVTYEQGQHAIVETARGIEYGEVVIANKEIDESEVVQPLKKVIRLATPEDDEKYRQNKIKEKEAFFICKEKIIKHKLDMKLIDVEYTFDNNKVLFYFTSYERVDFRELVKELASIFKTRIELRQIGVRDETKMCGGIGICGRSLCCNTFLGDFQPVSIKMAKEQSLSLNPIKISGICGRLMCCLKYEQDCYVEIRDRLPVVGDTVITPDGKGEVLSVNVLREQVKVAVKKKDKDEKEAIMYLAKDLKIIGKKKKCGGGCCGNNRGDIDKEYEGFDFSSLE